jgi:hypothetical protein
MLGVHALEKSSLLDHKIEQTHEQHKGRDSASAMAQYIKKSRKVGSQPVREQLTVE